MKVYVVLYGREYRCDNDSRVLGVYSTKEDAQSALIDYAENYIKENNTSYYEEDEMWYNEDCSYFTAYHERNPFVYDCEWIRIEEKELDKDDFDKQ